MALRRLMRVSAKCSMLPAEEEQVNLRLTRNIILNSEVAKGVWAG